MIYLQHSSACDVFRLLVLPSLLERMPYMESKQESGEHIQNGEVNQEEWDSNILDERENKKNIDDSKVLLDILSESGDAAPIPTETSKPINSVTGNTDLLDLIGGFDLNLSTPGIPSITAFEKNGLKITFEFSKETDNPQMLVVNLVATNQNLIPITDFLFQAAVPKTCQLQLLPPTSNIIPANSLGNIQQTLKITNPNKGQLRLKMRISYSVNGNAVLEQAEVNNFPLEIYQ